MVSEIYKKSSRNVFEFIDRNDYRSTKFRIEASNTIQVMGNRTNRKIKSVWRLKRSICKNSAGYIQCR